MLIPSALIALVSFFAAVVMYLKKHYENAFTRACVTVFYLMLAIAPSISIEVARALARWFWLLVFGVEIVWWLVNTWMRRRRSTK